MAVEYAKGERHMLEGKAVIGKRIMAYLVDSLVLLAIGFGVGVVRGDEEQ